MKLSGVNVRDTYRPCSPSQGHVRLKVNTNIITDSQTHTTHCRDAREQAKPPVHAHCVPRGLRREQLQETADIFALVSTAQKSPSTLPI